MLADSLVMTAAVAAVNYNHTINHRPLTNLCRAGGVKTVPWAKVKGLPAFFIRSRYYLRHLWQAYHTKQQYGDGAGNTVEENSSVFYVI